MIKGTAVNRLVTIDDQPLLAVRSQALFNHSPDGFNWGYQGSGPAQLALALLLWFGASNDDAVKFHQQFKREVIATLPQGEDFAINNHVVTDWLRERWKAQEGDNG